MKTTFRQSGMSLIEVMVVLVVLLVGILSVVRLFPPGFLVNKNTESTTLATRLAKQESDRYTTESANLMDAIVPLRWDNTAGTFVIDTECRPDDLSDAPANPPWDYYFSNANRIRRIMGESVRIPVPTDTSAAGVGAVYMLSSGPFMDIKWNQVTNPNAHNLFISGSPMIRIVEDVTPGGQMPGNPPPPSQFVRRPSQYVVDYEGGLIGFAPAPYYREFIVTFSYYNNGQVVTVPQATIAVQANTDQWYQFPGATGPVVPDSDDVSRKFVEIDPAGTWDSNDPYQYKVISANVPGALPANVGVIGFNPVGRNYNEQAAGGGKPLIARISYDVLDWHIIREDRPMPAAPPYRVTLTLNGLKKIGDFEADQTRYDGLFYGAGGSPDLMIYNVETGTAVPPNAFTVDYKAGTVDFDPTFGGQNASATFRFYYKAHGDWALQVQKACSSYSQNGGPGVAYNQYYLGAGQNDATRMYFAACESGKTVAVREYWWRDVNGNLYRANNETFRINSDPAKYANYAGRPLTWIDIRDRHPDAAAWNLNTAGQPASGSGTPVLGVQGVSFRTRVIWNTGSQVDQTAPGVNQVLTRWHWIDLDTVLSRETN